MTLQSFKRDGYGVWHLQTLLKWILSDEELMLKTSAFWISVWWPIHIINPVDKTKLPPYM